MPDPLTGPSRLRHRIVLGMLIALASVNVGYLVVRLLRAPAGMHRLSGDRQSARTDLFRLLPPDSGAIVLMGDSHLEHFPLTELFPGLPVVNRGVSGSTTRDALARAQVSCGAAPARIVVHVGVNDLFKGGDAAQFEADLSALLDTLRKSHPSTPITVDELLPTADRGMDSEVRRCNAAIARAAARPGITVLPLYAAFNAGDGIDPTLTYDGVHLNAKGYAKWTDLLKPVITSTDRQ